MSWICDTSTSLLTFNTQNYDELRTVLTLLTSEWAVTLQSPKCPNIFFSLARNNCDTKARWGGLSSVVIQYWVEGVTMSRSVSWHLVLPLCDRAISYQTVTDQLGGSSRSEGSNIYFRVG